MKLLKNNTRKNRIINKLRKQNATLKEDIDIDFFRGLCHYIDIDNENSELKEQIKEGSLLIDELLEIKRKYFSLIKSLEI